MARSRLGNTTRRAKRHSAGRRARSAPASMDAARAAMRLTGMREEFMGTDGGSGAPREAEDPGAGLAAAIGAHAPAVVRRFAARWPCCSAAGLPQHEWSDANLAAWVGDEHVRVRVAEREPSECVAGRAEADDCGAHAFGDPAVADSRGDVYSWRTVRFRDFLTAAQADAESAAKGTAGGSASRLYAARVSLRALPELATRVPPAAELCPAVARCCGEPVDALATMYCGGATSTPCHFDPHEGFVIVRVGAGQTGGALERGSGRQRARLRMLCSSFG